MNERTLRIGTRGSLLALTQSGIVRDAIIASGTPAELVVIVTTGDRIQDRPLQEVGGKGLFTREIETELLEGRIDMAIHSLKDLPYQLPTGLTLTAFPERADPRDVLIPKDASVRSISDLAQGATVATGSLRRKAQLLRVRPDLHVIGIRGNVDTRLRKVREGHDGMEATVVAAAGIHRLGLDIPSAVPLDTEQMLPAVCQGLLALQVRDSDSDICARLAPIEHRESTIAARAERAFLRTLQGDCNVPLAAHALVDKDSVTLRGLVCGEKAEPWYVGQESGAHSEAESVGIGLATRLMEQGATEVLRAVKRGQ